jgi:hypothetical protein
MPVTMPHVCVSLLFKRILSVVLIAMMTQEMAKIEMPLAQSLFMISGLELTHDPCRANFNITRF